MITITITIEQKIFYVLKRLSSPSMQTKANFHAERIEKIVIDG